MTDDVILIRDLACDAVIGTLPEERTKRQTLLFNLELFTDLAPAGASDDLRDSVNYSAVEEKVKVIAESTQYFLLEKMAEVVADAILTFDRVEKVTVTIDKPAAPRFARSIAVRISRMKQVHHGKSL